LKAFAPARAKRLSYVASLASALPDYLIESSSGFRVAQAAGVQSEMELAFASLHQLCAPMLDRLSPLPGPQGDAMRTAFGISPGPPPHRFVVACDETHAAGFRFVRK
jgi:hypothetical protein